MEKVYPESRSNQILTRQTAYIQSTIKKLDLLFSISHGEIFSNATDESNKEVFNLTPTQEPSVNYEAIAKDNEIEDVRNLARTLATKFKSVTRRR